MNRKTWDDDNLLDGEIIHCNVCGLEEAYFSTSLAPLAYHLEHTCYYCGWDIHQTEKSVVVSWQQKYQRDDHVNHINQVEYGHIGCTDKQYGCLKDASWRHNLVKR